MRRDDFANAPCMIARTTDLIGDRWVPMLLRDLSFGVTRFDRLQHDLGLSRKVLAERLRKLVDQGVVVRTPYQDNPARYDYHLTDKGQDLMAVVRAMRAFGEKWLPLEQGPPLRIIHLTCGKPTHAVAHCSECGEVLGHGEFVPVRGPGFDPDVFPEIARVLGENERMLADRAAAALADPA